MLYLYINTYNIFVNANKYINILIYIDVYVLNYLMYILIISQSYQTIMYNLVNNVLIEVYINMIFNTIVTIVTVLEYLPIIIKAAKKEVDSFAMVTHKQACADIQRSKMHSTEQMMQGKRRI